MELLSLSRRDVEELGISMREVLKVVDHGFRLRGLSKEAEILGAMSGKSLLLYGVR